MYFEREGRSREDEGDKNEVEDIVPVIENAIIKLQRTHASLEQGWEGVKSDNIL